MGNGSPNPTPLQLETLKPGTLESRKFKGPNNHVLSQIVTYVTTIRNLST